MTKTNRFFSSIRTLHQPERFSRNGSGLPIQSYPLRSILWISELIRFSVRLSRRCHSRYCAQASSCHSFCMTSPIALNRNTVGIGINQLMRMIITHAVIEIRLNPIQPRLVRFAIERITHIHMKRKPIAIQGLMQKDGNCRGHVHAQPREQQFRVILNPIIDSYVYLCHSILSIHTICRILYHICIALSTQRL